MKKMQSRSPLKGPPLRSPGQSLRDRILDVMFDDALAYTMVAFFFLALTVFESGGAIFGTPRRPGLFGILTFLIAGVATVRIHKGLRKVEDLRLGMEGEKEVGQLIEDFRKDGFVVFHDIPGDAVRGEHFNLDHVMIGPPGILVIETKTRRKPEGREPKIKFKGSVVEVDGWETDEPLRQATAGADWLIRLLRESTGRTYRVQPVVVYPGWWVECLVKDAKVWVDNPKMLFRRVRGLPPSLTKEDVSMATYHLTRYVQALASRQ